MQRWEYTVLTVREGIVVSANGRMVAKQNFLGEIKEGPGLFHFLNELGQSGWEVVGVSPITGSGDFRSAVELTVILKKPLS